MYILALTIVTLQIGPKSRNDNFIENGLNDIDAISVVSWDHAPKSNCMCTFFEKITAPKGSKAKYRFCQNRSDFIFVRYSENNSGLGSNSWFRFQGYLVKVNRIWESICEVFAQIFVSTTQ
jgi:hypothetical protein